MVPYVNMSGASGQSWLNGTKSSHPILYKAAYMEAVCGVVGMDRELD